MDQLPEHRRALHQQSLHRLQGRGEPDQGHRPGAAGASHLEEVSGGVVVVGLEVVIEVLVVLVCMFGGSSMYI